MKIYREWWIGFHCNLARYVRYSVFCDSRRILEEGAELGCVRHYSYR